MVDSAAKQLSALIQVQRNVGNAGIPRQTGAQEDAETDQAKARDAANKFEALLIHNMLTSMRKTTMAENTSNQRALYDDMLDKNLADAMIKAGGLGISDQLMKQLGSRNSTESRQTPVSTETPSTLTREHLKLRELALSLNEPDKSAGSTASSARVATDERLVRSGQHGGTTNAIDSTSDDSHSRTDFLQILAPHAQRSAQRLGTSASAIMAIAALETGWGKAMLKDESGASSNNYFGIKAGTTDEKFTSNTTTEYLNGRSQIVNARFKLYDSTADSVKGFADFILENPRYTTALQHASNPERFLRELHHAGYATDPGYADKAITVMRQVEQQTSKP